MTRAIEINNNSTVELIRVAGSDEDFAHAAWVSNFAAAAKDKTASLERLTGLINFLWREKHTSPFEHGQMTFFIDTQLDVAREFMRHRTFSYNETSGRYKEMEGRFYVPPFGRPLVQIGKVGAYTFSAGTEEQYAIMQRDFSIAYEEAWQRYQHMLSYGIAKEVARKVLPLGLYTQFYATANPRNILAMLMLRNDDNAMYEIRQIAIDIESLFAQHFPITYQAFTSQRELWEKVKSLLQVADIDLLLKEHNEKE